MEQRLNNSVITIFTTWNFCQAGLYKIVKLRVKVKVKSQKSKLDPELGFVMGWSTTHHPPPPLDFFWA